MTKGPEASELLPIQYWPCMQKSWTWALGAEMVRLVILYARKSALTGEMVRSLLVLYCRILTNPFSRLGNLLVSLKAETVNVCENCHNSTLSRITISTCVPRSCTTFLT